MRSVVEMGAIPSDVESLRARVIALDAALSERDVEIAQLREYIRLLKSQRFGAKSEQSHRSQLGLFNEAEVLAAAERAAADAPGIAVAAHTRTPRGRRPLPAWMPREEILHDLPEAEKVCPHDGSALVEIGRESSEQLEFVPATARVLVHVRPRYGCPTCKTGVHTAPLPRNRSRRAWPRRRSSPTWRSRSTPMRSRSTARSRSSDASGSISRGPPWPCGWCAAASSCSRS